MDAFSKPNTSFFGLPIEIRDRIYDHFWKCNGLIHVEYYGSYFWLQHRQLSSSPRHGLWLNKGRLDEYDEEIWHRPIPAPSLLLASKGVRREALAQLVRNSAWWFANDIFEDWEAIHPLSQSNAVKIEGIGGTSPWKNHTFDFTVSLQETTDGVLKTRNSYGWSRAYRHKAKRVQVRNPDDRIQRLCATSHPTGSTVRHLTLTLILALYRPSPWVFILDDLYPMASALPALCTITVRIVPSPEHEHRYFRRSIMCGYGPAGNIMLAKNQIEEAAYPAIVDLGKALFCEKEFTCEDGGWERETYILELSTGDGI